MPNSLSELHTLHAWEDNQITECCTQGEYAGKVLQFKLVDKDGAISLSNCLVQYAVTRPDKTEDLLECTVDNGIVKCNLTYSVTSISGIVHGEVRVIGSNDSGIIKFYGVNLRVYKGVSDEAAEQSDEFTALIAALQKVGVVEPDGSNTVELDETIRQNGTNPVASGLIYDALLLKANIADVYTKTESDTALALKANAGDVYTKAEADGALSRKVDTSTFNYQFGNVIAALNTKADAEEVYKKSEVYSKSEVDEAVNNKATELAYSFSPKAVYKDKLVRGWKNYVPVDDPTYGDPVFGDLEGATSIIIPVDGRDGSVSWSTDIAHTAQVIALGSDMKRVENMPAHVDGTNASIDLTRDFTQSDFKYLCFWTTDVKSIIFNNILSKESFYLSGDGADLSNYYTKKEVNNKLDRKADLIQYSFTPTKVLSDKRVAGWKNYVPVDDPTYGDPVYVDYKGATSLVVPIEGKDGSVSWSTDIAYTAQVVALGTDMKHVENMPAHVDGTTASIDLTRDFTWSDVKYLCFWTTDVKSIEFNNILPNKSLYKSSEGSAESGKFEITNDKPITPDFNPPYLYSTETPLYIYPQSLFNKPFNMVYNTGVNSIVQNGHNGFSIKNVTGLPNRTRVTIADGKKVLFIGDSYTAHEVYHKVVYDTITSLGKSITLLGTWGDGVYKHEGRSGWRNYTFAKCANQTDDSAFSGGTSIPNPFYNEEKGQFDFEYYVQKKINNVVPDIVFVNLGANDMARGDHKSEADICEYISIIVDSIKSVSSSIKVVYWLPNQFPVGINAGYDRWQGTIEYSKILIKNQQALGIDELCPVRYAFDCTHDGKFVTENINGHDMIYLADITHPSNLGYEHIAQMIIPYIHD